MARYKDKSFWLTTRDYEPGPPLLDSVDVDVAVIGAGFTGLTTAYFLHQAEPGLRIAVLEADVVGYGASGRNAGFSMTKIGMMHSITELRFGRHERGGGPPVRRPRGDPGPGSGRRPRARLRLRAPRLAHRRDVQREVPAGCSRRSRWSEELGITGIKLIDADALAERVDSPLYVGGVVGAELRHPQPGQAVLGLARRVIEPAGIEVYESTPVSWRYPGPAARRS